MRQLFGRANSVNVMKVLWLLDELELPFQRHDLGGSFGGTNTPEYLSMNPNMVVPTLVEDDFVLWESNVILRYLCTAHRPDSPLWPTDVRARANADRWMDWAQTTLAPPMAPAFIGLIRTKPEHRDQAGVDAALGKLATFYGMLDRVLARQAYVAGANFTLADIATGVHAHRWISFDIDKPAYPHLRIWYERLLERLAFRQHVGGPLS